VSCMRGDKGFDRRSIHRSRSQKFAPRAEFSPFSEITEPPMCVMAVWDIQGGAVFYGIMSYASLGCLRSARPPVSGTFLSKVSDRHLANRATTRRAELTKSESLMPSMTARRHVMSATRCVSFRLSVAQIQARDQPSMVESYAKPSSTLDAQAVNNVAFSTQHRLTPGSEKRASQQSFGAARVKTSSTL